MLCWAPQLTPRSPPLASLSLRLKYLCELHYAFQLSKFISFYLTGWIVTPCEDAVLKAFPLLINLQ